MRAAEITAKRLSATRYEITLVLFADWINVADNPESEVPNFMDTTSVYIQGQKYTINRKGSYELVGDSNYFSTRNVYVGEFNFPAVGASYTIGFLEYNRNSSIANINDSNSEVPFYVSMQLKPAVSDVNNSSPVLLVPPIDEAAVNRIYTHNPGAYDPDGDSLSYKLVVPKMLPDQDVPNYRSPADPSFGGGASIYIDPVTGDLSWESPRKVGIYNIAIEITEWGTSPIGAYVKSVVVRDMQINVTNSTNQPPVVIAPSDTCVEAGKFFKNKFSGYDPNNDKLDVPQRYGSALENGAFFGITYYRDSLLSNIDSSIYQWQPTCDLVQEQPYYITFKLTDSYVLPLSTLHTHLIKVTLPAPDIKSVKEDNSALKIIWDEYLCKNSINKIKIWRISCDTLDVIRDNCTLGVPNDWGATLVAETTNTDTMYVDKDVEIGETYCYLLTAENSQGVESMPSFIRCGALKLTAPLITNVSVLNTDKAEGKIEVKWGIPLEVDTIQNNGPFRYELFRKEGINEEPFPSNALAIIDVDSLVGGGFIDSLLNTEEKNYTYKVDFYNDTNLVSTSHESSFLRISAESKFERVELNVESRVIWQFPDSLTSIVYREREDSVFVFDTLYGALEGQAIEGLTNGEEYCFYIETKTVFCGLDLNEQPFLNKTNRICVIPFDSTPPCPPALSINELNCDEIDEFTSLSINELSWTGGYEDSNECENDIVQFKLYYQSTTDVEFELLKDFSPLTFKYEHNQELSRAGCYYVTAVDQIGFESEQSNIVCNDNCEFIEFPNIITPNGDFKNEVFIPIPTPRNVESIKFDVYNRLGKLVYSSSNDPDINWGGTSFNGDLLNQGTYYYTATVTFFKLNAEEKEQVFNGWVLINR